MNKFVHTENVVDPDIVEFMNGDDSACANAIRLVFDTLQEMIKHAEKERGLNIVSGKYPDCIGGSKYLIITKEL